VSRWKTTVFYCNVLCNMLIFFDVTAIICFNDVFVVVVVDGSCWTNALKGTTYERWIVEGSFFVVMAEDSTAEMSVKVGDFVVVGIVVVSGRWIIMLLLLLLLLLGRCEFLKDGRKPMMIGTLDSQYVYYLTIIAIRYD